MIQVDGMKITGTAASSGDKAENNTVTQPSDSQGATSASAGAGAGAGIGAGDTAAPKEAAGAAGEDAEAGRQSRRKVKTCCFFSVSVKT